jgi:DNA-binding transcriptional LysR family regulator
VCSDPDIVAHSSLTVTKLTRLSLAMLVRRGHPLTFVEKLQPDDVVLYPLIRSRPFEGDEDGPVIVGPSHARPPAVTVEDYEVLTRLAFNSDSIWVTTLLASQDAISRGDLVELPISWLPQAPTTILTAYSPAGRVVSPLVRTMLDQLAAISAGLPAAISADSSG